MFKWVKPTYVKTWGLKMGGCLFEGGLLEDTTVVLAYGESERAWNHLPNVSSL